MLGVPMMLFYDVLFVSLSVMSIGCSFIIVSPLFSDPCPSPCFCHVPCSIPSVGVVLPCMVCRPLVCWCDGRLVSSVYLQWRGQFKSGAHTPLTHTTCPVIS